MNNEKIVDNINYNILYYSNLHNFFSEDLEKNNKFYPKEFNERIKTKIECYDKFTKDLIEIKENILRRCKNE